MAANLKSGNLKSFLSTSVRPLQPLPPCRSALYNCCRRASPPPIVVAVVLVRPLQLLLPCLSAPCSCCCRASPPALDIRPAVTTRQLPPAIVTGRQPAALELGSRQSSSPAVVHHFENVLTSFLNCKAAIYFFPLEGLFMLYILLFFIIFGFESMYSLYSVKKLMGSMKEVLKLK